MIINLNKKLKKDLIVDLNLQALIRTSEVCSKLLLPQKKFAFIPIKTADNKIICFDWYYSIPCNPEITFIDTKKTINKENVNKNLSEKEVIDNLRIIDYTSNYVEDKREINYSVDYYNNYGPFIVISSALLVPETKKVLGLDLYLSRQEIKTSHATYNLHGNDAKWILNRIKSVTETKIYIY